MAEAPRNLIGPKVRQLRDRLGLSQSDFAARCQVKGWDISRDIVAAIEGQVRCVTESEVVMLAAMLEVAPASLLPTPAKAFAAMPPMLKKKG